MAYCIGFQKGKEVPNGHDREWVRLCSAVDGFRTRFGQWPTRVRLFPESLADIRDNILTSEGFSLVTARVDLAPEEGATFIAEDADGNRFNYGTDELEASPDIKAKNWFGSPGHRSYEPDLLELGCVWNPQGKLVFPKLNISRVRYIKLGPAGKWESECFDNGIARFGFDSASAERFPLCRDGKWGELRASFMQDGKSKGIATNFVNQTRVFFEDQGQVLWITFIGDRLCWGMLDGSPAERHPDGEGAFRTLKDGWRTKDLRGECLTKDRLAGALTQITGFRGTSCDAPVADYVLRRIKGEKTPEVERAIATLNEMSERVLAMIRLLDPKDFEVLVDIIFSTSGWRRQGVVGKTTKTLDLDLLLPSTGERAFVQVKSKTTAKELREYIEALESLDSYERMFFVYHTGENIESDDKKVIVVGPQKLAEMAIDAGLVNWLIRKVA